MSMDGVTEHKLVPKQQAARMDFLWAYQGFQSLPGTDDDVTEAGRAALDSVVERMKYAGLYARSSADADVRWGVRVLVTALRKATRRQGCEG